MISAFVIDLILFLLPLAVYGLYLVLTARNPLHPASWTRARIAVLSLAGIIFAVFFIKVVGEHAGTQLSGRNQAAEAAAQKK